MTRHLITLALALSLSAPGSTALAGKRCPWNDKEEPENAKICKAGTMQVCKDGQWVSLGTKCSAKFRDDDRADAPGARRWFGEPQPVRIVARITPGRD
jgi:hypothetical protein